MLRKRTSFKPNLSQVAAPKTTNQQSAPAAAGSPDGGAPPLDTNDGSITTTKQVTRPRSPVKGLTAAQVEAFKDRQQPDGTTNYTVNQTGCGDEDDAGLSGKQSIPAITTPSMTTTKEIDEASSKRVHEAITQLTGQKFEPIKSISLRNSANKNVKLKDLLFFNPPLTKEQKRHRKNIYIAKKTERKKLIEEQSKATDDINQEDSNNNSSDAVEMATDDEPSLVPKVKLGPDGKLILDESSTIINRKNSIKEQEAIIEDNEEVISRTNYDSYRRKPASTSQTKWSLDDTQKFYQALTIFGADFSMMESLLFSGHRSRTELHKKFKREERLNKTKIDIALSNRISLDSEELDELRDVFYKTS